MPRFQKMPKNHLETKFVRISTFNKFRNELFHERILIISCCGRHVNYVTIGAIKRVMKCKKVVNSQSKAENSVLTGASESNSG